MASKWKGSRDDTIAMSLEDWGSGLGWVPSEGLPSAVTDPNLSGGHVCLVSDFVLVSKHNVEPLMCTCSVFVTDEQVSGAFCWFAPQTPAVAGAGAGSQRPTRLPCEWEGL